MFAPELIAFANSYIIFILILGLTGPDSLLRPAGLPLIFVNVYSAVFRPSMIRLKAPHISNMLGGLIFGMALEYLDTVLLSAWTYETNGPTSSRGGQKPSIALQQKSRAAHGIQHRFWWAASHIFNYRFIGTPWEVPNVPAFSKSDPDYVPSKRQFLWSSLCAVMLSLFLLDCTSLMSAPPEEIGVLFSKEREGFFSRLGSVTVEEVPTRLITIFMASLCIYLLFQVIYCTTAFIMVGLRLSDLRTWRPLYGSVGDAWSLRSFWGYVSHWLCRNLG